MLQSKPHDTIYYRHCPATTLLFTARWWEWVNERIYIEKNNNVKLHKETFVPFAQHLLKLDSKSSTHPPCVCKATAVETKTKLCTIFTFFERHQNFHWSYRSKGCGKRERQFTKNSRAHMSKTVSLNSSNILTSARSQGADLFDHDWGPAFMQAHPLFCGHHGIVNSAQATSVWRFAWQSERRI